MRSVVNTWIADSDNVLLIKPISKIKSIKKSKKSEVGMFTCLDKKPLTKNKITKLRKEVEKAIKDSDGKLIATFTTDPAKNNYPRHPIRTGEFGLVWFVSFKKFKMLSIPHLQQRRLIPTKHSKMR